MKNKIIIISGDPNSINSEIIYKTWNAINNATKRNIYFISNYLLLREQFKKLNYSLRLIKVKNINECENDNALKIINININFKNPFKVSHKSASKFVIESLNLAHTLGKKEDISGIINCPISKNLLNKKKIGVTEYLAAMSKIRDGSEVMLIRNKNLSVSPITTHIDIKEVSKKLNSRSLINKVKTINNSFKKIFKKKPRIGILGLNPHNAELIKNSEEKKFIIPTISKLKKLGINCDGPLIADTIFIKDYKNYDVVVGMYHDQVLAPFKAIFKFDAINITLGLNYLRLSPDHGVASDIIGKNIANYTSLFKCIDFLSKYKK